MSGFEPVRSFRNTVDGFRCQECGHLFQSMWGDTCNGCRETERRHQEMLKAIRACTQPPTTEPDHD